jgi:hypothetical protein
MKKKLVSSAFLVLVALMLAVMPVSAVMYGQPDGNGHPYVGLVVFYADEQATQPLWRCTGTLISPTVLLTAGHCAEDFSTKRAQVWFDSTIQVPPYPLSGGVLGTPISDPQWNGSLALPNTHDVGVVILDTPVTDRGFGALPTEGFLDGLATQRGLQDVSFTIVGYGLQSVKPVESALRERFVGQTHLVNLRSALTNGYNIQLSSNPGNWSGGTCFGDSGGPIFYSDTNIITAVNSFVLNSNCKGAGFGYRVDTTSAREFLGQYVTLP